MTTSTVTPEIAAFARGVRVALADLPADEVDDLTDGLEADLAEAYAEDLQRELPDPSAYASELRLAAGLPARGRVKSGVVAGIQQGWRATRADLASSIRRNPALSSASDFLVVLRPAWWVFRAWLATWLLAAFFGTEQGYWFSGTVWFVVLVTFVVVSVQWGRGKWHLARGMSALLLVGNVIAAVLAVPVLAHAADGRVVYYGEPYPEQADLTGVYLNGEPVTNIFGYDAKGRPLQDIQLFDQDGNPLATSVEGGNGCLDPACEKQGLWVPAALRTGVTAWNVFPMRMIEADAYADHLELQAVPGAEPQDRVSPFVKVPALLPVPKAEVKP